MATLYSREGRVKLNAPCASHTGRRKETVGSNTKGKCHEHDTTTMIWRRKEIFRLLCRPKFRRDKSEKRPRSNLRKKDTKIRVYNGIPLEHVWDLRRLMIFLRSLPDNCPGRRLGRKSTWYIMYTKSRRKKESGIGYAKVYHSSSHPAPWLLSMYTPKGKNCMSLAN